MAFTTRKDLLQDVHNNDQQAWNDFVEYYTPLIMLCAKDFSLTQQESEELRQIVCLAVFKKDLTGQYDETKGHFRTFIRKVISNNAIDIIRKRKPTLPIENASQIPEETEDKFEERWRKFIYEKALQVLLNIFTLESHRFQKTVALKRDNTHNNIDLGKLVLLNLPKSHKKT